VPKHFIGVSVGKRNAELAGSPASTFFIGIAYGDNGRAILPPPGAQMVIAHPAGTDKSHPQGSSGSLICSRQILVPREPELMQTCDIDMCEMIPMMPVLSIKYKNWKKQHDELSASMMCCLNKKTNSLPIAK
jgi:hypothetical protein